MSVSKNTMKNDRSTYRACLGDIIAKLTPFMPVLALITRVISSFHLLQLESMVLR